VHVDFSNTDSFSEVIKTYTDAGVSIVSIGVNGMKGDEETERLYFEFLKAADAKFMSVSFDVSSVPQSYRVAERLAEEYDVFLGIHNHGGRHWLGSTEMLRQVFAATNERIGFCIDTAWASILEKIR
jgi:inosose dehydratase